MDKNEDKQHGRAVLTDVMSWHGWGSPVGVGIGIALTLSSLGFMLWMFSLAGLL